MTASINGESGFGMPYTTCDNGSAPEGRRAIGVESEERYCETVAKRLAQDTLFGGVA